MEQEPGLELPIKDLDLVLQACDPSEPLEPGDRRYADLSSLRQGAGITRRRRELLAPLPRGQFYHRCLCGHRGSGKSTELLALKKWADEQGFLTVLTEVDEHFGLIELEFSDLFLLAATVVEQAMAKSGHPLPGDKIRPIIEWFAEIVRESKQDIKSELAAEATAQLGGTLPLGLGKLLAKFTAGIKAASTHAVSTRQTMRNFPDRLTDLTNELLRSANQILASAGVTRGLLLLFDNLDRYEPERIDRVLFRGSDLIRRMQCHALFTIPIALEYEPLSGPTQDCYGVSIMLPMLSLRHKEQRWSETVASTIFDDEAVALVRGALALRMDLSLFKEPEDVDLLVKMSGGCMRDLMHLVTLAFTHSGEECKFTPDAIRQAIRELRATYVRRMNADDFSYLGAIARREWTLDTAQPASEIEARKRRLLFHRFALEYLDQESQPWIDVHPVVIEIEEFRRAFNNRSPLSPV